MGKGEGKGSDGTPAVSGRLIPDPKPGEGPYQGPFPPLDDVRKALQIRWCVTSTESCLTYYRHRVQSSSYR